MVMGEAKRREELGLPPRQKKVEFNKSYKKIVLYIKINYLKFIWPSLNIDSLYLPDLM